MEKSTSQRQFTVFSAELSRLKKVKIFQDQQKPFSEFQQPAAVETSVKFRYKSFLKSCLYSTLFTFNKFVFKFVVACYFWVACVIINMLRRKPFEFKWPEACFNTKQTSMARVLYNKLLTNLASLSCTGEYWPSVVFVQTELCSVHTAMTSGQYSPVWPLHSVSERLIFLSQ